MKKFDYILFWTTIILLILGIIIISSASASSSQEKFGNTFYYLNHQIIFGIIPGIILAILAFKIPINFLKKYSFFLILINLILLGMIFINGIGLEIGGARRWISVGKIIFQPSEFLKLTFILYLANWLGNRVDIKENKNKIKKNKNILFFIDQTFIAFLIIIGLVAGLLILQPDIGSLGIIFLTGVLIYFLAGTTIWHSVLIILISIFGLLFLIKIASYRLNRLLVFLKPEIDPMGLGYQIKQSLIAIGSGGIFGLGLGMSNQKYFLPNSISDSIFAIFSEETGFIGVIILIFFFLIFLWRGFEIAKKSTDRFCQLTAVGITFWIISQSFINISTMIGVLPLTGLPLPFISYGGSALATELIGVGILLNISKQKY